jgi:hypothetical protein
MFRAGAVDLRLVLMAVAAFLMGLSATLASAALPH